MAELTVSLLGVYRLNSLDFGRRRIGLLNSIIPNVADYPLEEFLRSLEQFPNTPNYA